MASDVDLLQQAHHEVMEAQRRMAAVEEEHGRGHQVAGGTMVAGGAEALDKYIRVVLGFEDDELAGLMLGGVQEQLGLALDAIGANPGMLVPAAMGLFLSGVAHGKRFAELRGEAYGREAGS